MFCSTIIPTIGRATLSRAVQSVLDQSFTADEFEVIVVNDSGRPLEPATWQTSPRVRIIETLHRERCVARNAGAATAHGRYLHFLDDDDWLLPGAFEAFWNLSQQSPSTTWLYGVCRYADSSEKELGLFDLGASGNVYADMLVTGQGIQLQSALIRADAFWSIGGFAPELTFTQDIHLAREMALRFDAARTSSVVACVLRGAGWNSLTNYERAVDFYRQGRELNLSKPGTFSRLVTSARTDYLYGRMLQVFRTSTAWNLRHKKFFTAASRSLTALALLLFARQRIFSKEFWRGFISPPMYTRLA